MNMTNSSDNNFKERRRYPRYAVNYEVEIILGNKKIFASAVNMSVNGIGLLVPQKLNEGEIVKMNIQTSDEQSRKIMQAEARVIWCQYLNSLELYRAGLEIIEISEIKD